MSYGPDFRAMFARAAEMVDRILRGTSPAAIPVTLQTRPELIINQNTANALGVTVPKGMRRTAAIIR